MGWRLVLVLGAAGVLGLVGCERPDTTGEIVRRLVAEPGLAPPEIAESTPVVLVEVAVSGTTVVLPEPPIRQPGARLNLEGALARRRTSPPALWAVVTSPDGREVRYWCATTDEARVRITIPDRKGGRHRGGRHHTIGALTSIRIPFEPSGEVRFFRASGDLLASFRFGATPDEPLSRTPA